MPALGSAAAVAGVSAAAAYLNAKYHIRKDLRTIINLRKSEQEVIRAAKEKRLSPWNVFEQRVEELPPNTECLWSRQGRMTWQETHVEACRYAHFLLNTGVEPGRLVAFYLQNSLDFLIFYMATWALGTAPALINYNLAGEALIHCLKTSGSKILLVDADSECRARIEEVRERIEKELGISIYVLDADQKAKIASMQAVRPHDSFRENVAATDPGMLIFTSGTTGFPKACAYHIGRVWQGMGDRFKSMGFQSGPDGDRFYNCMPMYHGTGANVAIMCILSGITTCIGKKFSTSMFWDEIRASDSTAFVYVGETVRYLMSASPDPRDRDHRVRIIFGNGLRPDIWNRFRDRFGVETICEFFNSTEGVFGLLNINRGNFLAACVGHHGLLLRALLNNTFVPVEIDQETNTIVRSATTGYATRNPYSTGGEILVNVPDTSAFIGYWKNQSATDTKFARDVFKKGDLYYRTGDALRRDDEGRWHFLDRLGDTFRWKSENVSTAEVAVVLGNFPGVAEANVYGVQLPKHEGRAGCAALFIEPRDRATFDFKGLLAHARKELPRYAVPVFLRIVKDQAPMHNNKQNKVPLRKEGVELDKIRTGTGGPDDAIMWCPPKGEAYEEFCQADWDAVANGKARL